ncbi:histidine phosphatase family protein [Erythrobacter sp. THAF29]|uniref:SixA phosphatase family protein n=1 Tax=Erythrobacter sp. THAF29 TaxID=2587851 RepID=UPI001267EA31|nr:histidine phosphatase family protein [Erythrobacter sp. THAF29]QFT77300.1 Histidine phosphatase superfamily (branch 1) [Erythrobacter sp. THAF29]
MTKILGLLRHAKSDWDDIGQRDFDRGLNDRGRQGAALIGDHIRSHGIKWDMLIASPAVRVTATLDEALPELEAHFDKRLYLASSDTILEAVQDHAEKAGDNPDAILVSGHNPGLQEVLLDLVSPARENDLFREASVKFPTATFAVLECRIDDWAKLKNHCAELVHFARPRDLDPELGPEH